MQYLAASSDRMQIRRDIRGVVLGVAGFILTLQIVAILVIFIIVIIQNFDVIVHISEQIDETTTNALSGYILSVLAEAMDEYLGLGMMIGMICGLAWLIIIRGKRFFTSDIPRVNSKAKFGTLFLLLLFIFGVQGFMALALVVFEPLFNQGGGSLTDVLDESTTSLAITVWGALYIALIGPICEELVFRGAVMRKLERYGSNFAIIVSSLLFALYHMILFQAVFAFFIGIILAYTAGRFSLKWAILLHMINNGIAVLLTYVDNEILATAMGLIYIVSFVVMVVVLAVRRDLLAAQRTAGAPSEPRVFSRAFASPWLISYIAITGLISVWLIFA